MGEPLCSANAIFYSTLQQIMGKNPEHSRLIPEIDTCLASLRKYPLPLASPKHCQILEGFSKEIVALIKEHLESNKNEPRIVPVQEKVDSPTPSTSRELLIDLDLSPIAKKFPVISKRKREQEDNVRLKGDEDDEEVVIIEEEKVPIECIELDDDEDEEGEGDLALAIKLSQEINGQDLDQSEVESDLKRQRTQEEEDYQLALRLNEENYNLMNEEEEEVVQLSSLSKQNKLSHTFEEEIDQIVGMVGKRADAIPQESLGLDLDDLSVNVTPPVVGTPNSKRKKGSSVENLFSQDPVFANFEKGSKPCKRKAKSKEPLRRAGSTASENIFSQDPVFSQILDEDKEVERHSKQNGKDKNPIPGPSSASSSRNVHTMSDSGEESEAEEPSKVTKTKTKRNYVRKAEKVPKIPKEKKQTRGKKTQSKFVITEDELPEWFKDHHLSTSESNSQEQESSETLEEHRPAFTLRRGTFDVVLLVDTAEVAGGGQGGKKSRKEITPKELKSNGVLFETRKLNISDFCWIAKERVSINPNSLRQTKPKELVLPHAVERKRLDDLKSSIMDGRYKEQKFRLSQSGIANICYLIEGYGKHKKYWASDSMLQAINSAIASTSLMEGFKVEITADQPESMSFLTLMSRSLQEHYSNLTLKNCTKEDLEFNRVRNLETNLLTFEEFNECARKQNTFTTKELFDRMLMQQHGITSVSAKAITDKYPTLGQAIEAFRSDPDQFLSEVKAEDGKNIRPGVVKILSNLLHESNLI